MSFTVGSETNKTVEVVDDKTVPGQRIVLDPALTWAAGLVKTYTYSLAVAGGAAGACASHTNTATIDQPVGTDPSASVTVEGLYAGLYPPRRLRRRSLRRWSLRRWSLRRWSPRPWSPRPWSPRPVVTPPVVTPEVLPEQGFGKAVGSVRSELPGHGPGEAAQPVWRDRGLQAPGRHQGFTGSR